MAKIRKQIYLEKRQDQQLKRLAEARGVSEAEVIRQAIEREAELDTQTAEAEQTDLTPLAEFIKAARARRQLGITGEPYKWNREEIYAEREERYFKKRSEQ